MSIIQVDQNEIHPALVRMNLFWSSRLVLRKWDTKTSISSIFFNLTLRAQTNVIADK